MSERLQPGGKQPKLTPQELESLRRLRATLVGAGGDLQRSLIGPDDPLYTLKQELQNVFGAEEAVREAMLIMQDARSGDNRVFRRFSSWGQENSELMKKLIKIGKGFIAGAAAGAAFLSAGSFIGLSASEQAIIGIDMFWGIVGASFVYDNMSVQKDDSQ